jgi:hypothetical protein
MLRLAAYSACMGGITKYYNILDVEPEKKRWL